MELGKISFFLKNSLEKEGKKKEVKGTGPRNNCGNKCFAFYVPLMIGNM